MFLCFNTQYIILITLHFSKGIQIKEKVLGRKQLATEPTTIIDPLSGKEISNPKKIRDTSVKYCKRLLTNREPKDEFKDDLNYKKKVHESIMENKRDDKDEDLNRSKFESSWNILMRTRKEKYKFIFNGGTALKETLFELFKTVWRTEKCPSLWNKTQLIQLYKGSSDLGIGDLTNYRYLHIKNETSKMFCHMVMSGVKESLKKNMSSFQMARPGHRCQENLFILKSLMAINEKYDQMIICQFMDLEKFFDKEVLIDVLLEAKRNQITNKEYRLLYQLNKKREIRVITPVGESEEESVDEGLGQGGLESAILSSNSIANGLDDFFKESSSEIYYQNLRLKPRGYQDDLTRASRTVNDVKAGIARLEAMAEVKLL